MFLCYFRQRNKKTSCCMRSSPSHLDDQKKRNIITTKKRKEKFSQKYFKQIKNLIYRIIFKLQVTKKAILNTVSDLFWPKINRKFEIVIGFMYGTEYKTKLIGNYINSTNQRWSTWVSTRLHQNLNFINFILIHHLDTSLRSSAVM